MFCLGKGGCGIELAHNHCPLACTNEQKRQEK
jgi:hypothetical protein